MTATLLLVTCILRSLLSLGLMHGLQSEQAQVWWTRWTNAMGAALASLQDICSVNICVSAVSFSFWSPLIQASFNNFSFKLDLEFVLELNTPVKTHVQYQTQLVFITYICSRALA